MLVVGSAFKGQSALLQAAGLQGCGIRWVLGPKRDGWRSRGRLHDHGRFRSLRASKAAASDGSLVPKGTTVAAEKSLMKSSLAHYSIVAWHTPCQCFAYLCCLPVMVPCCRVRASKAAASDGSLVPRGTTGAAEGGYITVDEAEIRAEGVESALISVQRIVNLLAFNATKGITPALQARVNDVTDRPAWKPVPFRAWDKSATPWETSFTSFYLSQSSWLYWKRLSSVSGGIACV